MTNPRTQIALPYYKDEQLADFAQRAEGVTINSSVDFFLSGTPMAFVVIYVNIERLAESVVSILNEFPDYDLDVRY